jgi:hypothetical protein
MSEFSTWVAMHKHTAGPTVCPRHTGDGYSAGEANSPGQPHADPPIWRQSLQASMTVFTEPERAFWRQCMPMIPGGLVHPV